MVDQAQPLPLEGAAAHEEPTQKGRNRTKDGAPEGNLYVLSVAPLPGGSLKALSASCSKNKQGKGGLWTEAELGKGGGKTVYSNCVNISFWVVFFVCFVLFPTI